MKKILYLIISIPLFLLSSCDVHEFPYVPENAQVHLRLDYETQMSEWLHNYVGNKVVEEGIGRIYDNTQKRGEVRYIVRAYPINKNNNVSDYYTHEFLFKNNISGSYNYDVTLELPSGDYNIVVWSDIVPSSQTEYYHNVENFAEVVLCGEHKGNTDYRDAFFGNHNISLVSDIVERAPDTVAIAMQRPLAKFEFVTTDLQNFIAKELEYFTRLAATRGEMAPLELNTDNYKVVFLYAGFMPNTFNIFGNQPVDSYMGVIIESKLDVLGVEEASLGFDYVFIPDRKSKIAIQIGLYDQDDRQVALSDPIDVPLLRDHHTVLRGSYLMQQASGGIKIDPSFDGNHNIVIE